MKPQIKWSVQSAPRNGKRGEGRPAGRAASDSRTPVDKSAQEITFQRKLESILNTVERTNGLTPFPNAALLRSQSALYIKDDSGTKHRASSL